MPRSVQKVGVLLRSYLTVYDVDNNPVTGLVNGDFTKFLALDGVNDATVVTVAEIGNGRYVASFTPGSTGSWYLLVRQATYNKRGWDEEFDVTTNGVLSKTDVASAVWDSARAAYVGAGTFGEGVPVAPSGIGSTAMTAASLSRVADVVWRRTAANVEASADGDALAFRGAYGVMAKLVNRLEIVAAVLSIYRADDVTVLGTQNLSVDATADPIVGADTN